MSEFCFSNTTKTNFSSLLLSDLIFFCSFILSHPLYFSYFIFFSPYLLKLLSFLSPLFITTSLLLVALLTVSSSSHESSECEVGFFLTTYRTILDAFRSRLDDDDAQFDPFEGLEAYIVVFETSIFKVEEFHEESCLHAYDAQVLVKCSSNGGFNLGVSEAKSHNVEETTVEVTERKYEGNTLEDFLQDVGVYEDFTCKIEENEVEALGTEFSKVGENQDKSLKGRGSEAPDNKVRENPIEVTFTDNGGEYTSKVAEDFKFMNTNSGSFGSKRKENSIKMPSIDNGGEYTSKVIENFEIQDSNLGSFGSMRKEKEWKRTLACKLFEERQNVDEVEGMDLLWEAYEADSGKVKAKNKDKKGKKGEIECYEDEDDEEDMDGQLCCLQALKFSTGKMNMGMGRPNLVKISKAFKGISWFRHVSRHGKRGYI